MNKTLSLESIGINRNQWKYRYICNNMSSVIVNYDINKQLAVVEAVSYMPQISFELLKYKIFDSTFEIILVKRSKRFHWHTLADTERLMQLILDKACNLFCLHIILLHSQVGTVNIRCITVVIKNKMHVQCSVTGMNLKTSMDLWKSPSTIYQLC